jgi:F420-dependent oxidoreductase-like protein
MAAATLDAISGGRFRLGLGVSGPQVSEGWYGVPFARPLRRTREYVEIVRRALAREAPLEYDGEEWTLPLPDGLGRPLKLLARPVQDRIPIYLGAVGPKAIEQAGAIADGWLPFRLGPDELELLSTGAKSAGRDLGDIDIAPVVPLAVADDVATARDQVRPWLAFYLGAMGAPEKNFYVEAAERSGHGEAARAVQERFLAGDRVGAAAALSDAMIDEGAIAVTPDRLEARVAEVFAAGATTLLALPTGQDKAGAVRALAEVGARVGG